jgi:protein TonB
VAPEGPKGSETDKSEQKQEEKRQTKQPASQDQPVVAETPPPPQVPPPVVRDFQMPFIQLSSSDYAASNIGKQASLRPSAAAAAGAGQDSKAPAGPGSGPGGATLYPADWYREPSSTELGGYLRPDMPRTGWGMIACRTVAQHHVEDCYIIGESPRGSGFGRSVLNAAWQFLVLAPRVNGKEQTGTWVSIRITYTDGGAKAGPG